MILLHVMNIHFVDIILFVLLIQFLTLVPFLFFQKSSKGFSNRILGLFLLAKALCISSFLSFKLYNYTSVYFPHSLYFGTSFAILLGPTLYFYIRSSIKRDFRFSHIDIIHVLPFLVHFFILTIQYTIYNADAKREILLRGGLFTAQIWHIYYIVLYIYIISYTIAALWCVRQFRKDLKISPSRYEFVNLSWMTFILLGFLIKYSFDLCYILVDSNSLMSHAALIISRIILLVVINMMIYKALRQPSLLLGKEYDQTGRKQSLSDMSKETYLHKLLNYMEKERPYLDPELSLEQLSGMASIPPRSLTTVLNECLNQNFYDFINSYRVKESVCILRERNPKDKTVLEVLFEVGFNNKSSFNIAFKKHNGMTPTEYRKLQTSA